MGNPGISSPPVDCRAGGGTLASQMRGVMPRLIAQNDPHPRRETHPNPLQLNPAGGAPLDDGQGYLAGQSACKSFSHNSCGINPNLTKRLGRVNINDIYRKIGPILEDFALLQFS